MPDDAQLAAEDPTWDRDRWGSQGTPLVSARLPAPAGSVPAAAGNPTGRWDYGPGPPPPRQAAPASRPARGRCRTRTTTRSPNRPNRRCARRPAARGVPDRLRGHPAGQRRGPYPYLGRARRAYRFRVLNACTDRSAEPPALSGPLERADVGGADGTPADLDAGEVPMVDRRSARRAARRTGRPTAGAGGVPRPGRPGPGADPDRQRVRTAPGPGGPANRPIDYRVRPAGPDRAERPTAGPCCSPPANGPTCWSTSRLCPPGSTLILYNDCPAPLPALDPRNDHHTGAAGPRAPPDQSVPGVRPRHPYAAPDSGSPASRPRRFDLGRLRAGCPAGTR